MRNLRIYLKRITSVAISMMIVFAYPMSSYAGTAPNTSVKSITEIIKNKAEEAGEEIGEKAESAGKVIKDTTKKTGKAISNTANDVEEAVSSGAKAIKRSVDNFKMEEFSRGWEYTSKIVGTTVAANVGATYVTDVGNAIKTLENNINTNVNYNRGIAQEAGFTAEQWAADTYNIDATARGSKDRANRPKSTANGSADLVTDSGKSASSKYLKDGKESAKAQAATNTPDQCQALMQSYGEYCASTDSPMSFQDYFNQLDDADKKQLIDSKYIGQQRIVPKDQLEDARKELKRLRAKETAKGRTEVASRYDETLKNLDDKLKGADGTKSIPLTKEEAETLTKVAREKGIDESDLKALNVTTKTVIKPSYIIGESMKAGAQGAIINIAITMGPQIYQIMKELVETGELDEAELKQAGFDGMEAGAEGFVEGSVANAILVMCKAGKFGTQYVNVQPTTVATLTVIAINAAKYSYLLYKGRITPVEYADMMAEDIIIAVAAQGTGVLVQMLLPMIPGAYFAGSIAGSMLASGAISVGKDVIIEMQSEDGFDMMVVVDKESNKFANKKAIAETTLKSTLSGLSGLKKIFIKDQNIKIYQS